jgi:hypothetical protein
MQPSLRRHPERVQIAVQGLSADPRQAGNLGHGQLAPVVLLLGLAHGSGTELTLPATLAATGTAGGETGVPITVVNVAPPTLSFFGDARTFVR